jgi:hypothetical protein
MLSSETKLPLEFLCKKSNLTFDSNENVYISSVSLDDIFIISNFSIRKFNSSSVVLSIPDVLDVWMKKNSDSLRHIRDDFTIIGEFISGDNCVFNIVFSNIQLDITENTSIQFKHIQFTNIKYIYDMKKEYVILTNCVSGDFTENSGKRPEFKLIYNNYFKPRKIETLNPETFKYIDIVKTTTPEVYLIEKDFLYVPDIKTSKFLKKTFLHIKPGKSLNLKCVFNSFFKKWQLDHLIVTRSNPY